MLAACANPPGGKKIWKIEILKFEKAEHKLRSPQNNFPNFFFILIEILKLLLPLLEVEGMGFGLPGAVSAAQPMCFDISNHYLLCLCINVLIRLYYECIDTTLYLWSTNLTNTNPQNTGI